MLHVGIHHVLGAVFAGATAAALITAPTQRKWLLFGIPRGFVIDAAAPACTVGQVEQRPAAWARARTGSGEVVIDAASQSQPGDRRPWAVGQTPR